MTSLICTWAILLDECICDNKEFSHSGGNCDLWSFAFGAEMLIKVFDGWIEADGRQRCHVERAADREPAAGDMGLSAPHPPRYRGS